MAVKTAKDLHGRFVYLGKELGKLARQETLTDAEQDTMDQYIVEMNEIGPELEKLTARDKLISTAETMGKEGDGNGKNRLSGLVQLGPESDRSALNGGAQIITRNRIGAELAKQEWVKAYAGTRTGRSEDALRVSLSREQSSAYMYQGSDSEPAMRHALVTTEDTPLYMVPPQILPGIYRPRDYSLSARDVLINGRTNSDTIYFLRELLFTSAATEIGQATATGGASGLKPEASLTFEQDSAAVVTIAHWIPITRQAVADAAQLQSYVESRLLVGLDRRVNGQIINGTGAAGTMKGILATSGVQALDAAYFGANPTLNAGTDLENFDRIARARTLIDTVGDAMATFVILNPADYEEFMTTADDNGQYMGGGPWASGTFRTLWGLPVAVDRAMTAGTALVGDGSMAAVWDREDAQILMDTVDDQFIRNMLTILAELRAALTVFRGAAFAEVELA